MPSTRSNTDASPSSTPTSNTLYYSAEFSPSELRPTYHWAWNITHAGELWSTTAIDELSENVRRKTANYTKSYNAVLPSEVVSQIFSENLKKECEAKGVTTEGWEIKRLDKEALQEYLRASRP